MSRTARAIGLMITAGLLAGCSYDGLNALQLPGTQGAGDGAYQVAIELADVSNLVPNNPVRLRDVNVGTITDIALDDWTAVVTVSLNEEVRLPRNARAAIGQGSLLGAKYVQLDIPEGAASGEMFADGDTMPMTQTGGYPETEDVLASVAALLNGGGLQQIKTITGELRRVFDGRTPEIRDLLTQLDAFTTGLDEQKGEIVRAIDGLDRVSAAFAEQDPALRRALEEVPPALEVLERERADLVGTLDALGGFGVEADRVLGGVREDLAANLDNLEPTLRELADAGPALSGSLGLFGTLLFPLRTVDQTVRGDFINLSITVDMTLGTLDRTFLTNTPFAGALGEVATILANGGTVTDAVNPLLPAPLAEDRQLPGLSPGGGVVPEAGIGGLIPGNDTPDAEGPAAPEPAPDGSIGGLLDSVTGGNR